MKISNILKSTQARFAVIAAAVLASLKFLSDFKVPKDRIDFIIFGAGQLWIELSIVCALFLVYSLKNPLWTKAVSALDYFRATNLQTHGLTYKFSASLLAIVLGAGTWTGWIGEVYNQTSDAITRRMEVYRYAFGGKYTDQLHDSAMHRLSVGLPEQALLKFAQAQRWALTPKARLPRLKEYLDVTQSRIDLANEMHTVFEKNSKPAVNITGTAHLSGAFVLDREGYRFRESLRNRRDRVHEFHEFAVPAFSACGSGLDPEKEKSYSAECSLFAAQAFDRKISTCKELAEELCVRFPMSVASPDQRVRFYRELTDRYTGLNDMSAILALSESK